MEYLKEESEPKMNGKCKFNAPIFPIFFQERCYQVTLNLASKMKILNLSRYKNTSLEGDHKILMLATKNHKLPS